MVRKHFGYAHISQRCAGPVNAFCENCLNPYLNFHRPCFFATETVHPKGKIKKHSSQEQIRALRQAQRLESARDRLPASADLPSCKHNPEP